MRGPFIPREQRGDEWVPIQAEFEGWSPLAPPFLAGSANVNYFVRLNHAWRQAFRDALSATIVYYQLPELIHN